jgi:hypothetical protein
MSSLLKVSVSNGILGSFSITPSGDTTLNAVAIYRIVGGKVTTYIRDSRRPGRAHGTVTAYGAALESASLVHVAVSRSRRIPRCPRSTAGRQSSPAAQR